MLVGSPGWITLSQLRHLNCAGALRRLYTTALPSSGMSTASIGRDGIEDVSGVFLEYDSSYSKVAPGSSAPVGDTLRYCILR